MFRSSKFRLLGVCVALALALSGCASRGDPRDPLEGFNREVFKFNEAVDKAVLKPTAQGYDAAVPDPIKVMISSFFGNIGDLFVGVNNVLQGKFKEGISDFGRVGINSTFGFFGIADVATPMGLEKHEEDFGQTLGRWGVEPGPYLVLPFFGPSNLRDATGLIGDIATDPVTRSYPVDARNTAAGVRVVDTRAKFLSAESALDAAAMDDKYSYLKNAYLQRRRSLVYDGKPPKDKDDFYDSSESQSKEPSTK